MVPLSLLHFEEHEVATAALVCGLFEPQAMWEDLRMFFPSSCIRKAMVVMQVVVSPRHWSDQDVLTTIHATGGTFERMLCDMLHKCDELIKVH